MKTFETVRVLVQASFKNTLKDPINTNFPIKSCFFFLQLSLRKKFKILYLCFIFRRRFGHIREGYKLKKVVFLRKYPIFCQCIYLYLYLTFCRSFKPISVLARIWNFVWLFETCRGQLSTKSQIYLFFFLGCRAFRGPWNQGGSRPLLRNFKKKYAVFWDDFPYPTSKR